MTRTIFGRRQAVLRQRARQEAWRLALRDELDIRIRSNELPSEAVDALATVSATPSPPDWKNRP